MKLGEVITALQDYMAHTIGVDDDTEVLVQVPSAQIQGEVDDVKVMLIRSSNHYNNREIEATVILEVGQT